MNFKLLLVTLLSICIVVLGCKKEKTTEKEDDNQINKELPIIETSVISNITPTSATSGGTITSNGGAEITAKGICWSEKENPTLLDNKTEEGTGSEAFTSKMEGLFASTRYYVRAYATNEIGTSYGKNIEVITASAGGISIGATYEGGLIFFIDASGKHGLAAAPKDQGFAKWGCEGRNLLGTSTSFGTGKTNTENILKQCFTSKIAAALCDDLVLNGKDDWYLPSKGELRMMHENLYLKGLGDFMTNRYWSSSQFNANNAWFQFFNLNVNQGYYDKDLISYPVRAIREF